ncbi:MAG: hypothetical protein EOP41_07375 [Sphingobacteriaceae bacterium]|nr:MAG: hypothetical protein EOP41_07375 [Sphingobacteriaceae bacterium]
MSLEKINIRNGVLILMILLAAAMRFVHLDNSAIWVYISFALMVYIGTKLTKVNVASVFVGSILSVLVHWLLTDIDPWLYGTMYSKGISGYFESLVAAIPFERSLMMGNFVYGFILFGGFELAKAKFPALRLHRRLLSVQ